MGLSRRQAAVGTGISVGAALGMSANAEAADITVTSLADNGGGAATTLREAIVASNATPTVADRILFKSGLTGTITLGGTQLQISDGVQIIGPGSDKLTISGAGASRIFYAYPAPYPGPSEPVSISGVRLTGGAPGNTGGAIRSFNADLSISDVVIAGNAAATNGGGGIYLSQGSLRATDSTITGNTASSAGGAIRTFRSPMTITNSTITGNTAAGSLGAGGIYAYADSLTIQDSTISGNKTPTGRGGGIRSFNTAIAIRRSSVSGNTSGSTFAGAGIYAYTGSLSIQDSTISGNKAATGNGGGINAFNTPITIQRSTVSGNTAGGASGDGGGINAFGGSMAISSSTISGNTAGRRGGGIFQFTGPIPLLQNAIVADNAAVTAGSDLSGVFGAAFSLIESPSGATVNSTVAGSNITGKDPNLGPLADNGGPTLTEALLPKSPALDKGSASGSDQRGAPRPFNLKGVPSSGASGANGADIGAYERVVCAGVAVNRIGTPGKDKLVGTGARDGLLGLAGKDLLIGKGGSDALCGGAGRDVLRGGKGRDRLLGQAGMDRLFGGPGKDKLKGGPGRDRQRQ